jgi:D-arabinose 1-dehydrogenase-like Zn-dependent alcohol dehydrogenase
MSTSVEARNEPVTSMQDHTPSVRADAADYRAWVALAANQPMQRETVDLGPLGPEDVEVVVEHCGLCHSDLSVLNNEWGGSPTAIDTMLDFAARHGITPQTEHFPMSSINQAFARLAAGQAHYRLVLDADF